MNFSLPPSSLEDSFKGNTLLGEPFPTHDVTDEERKFMDDYKTVMVNYKKIKAIIDTGNGTNENRSELKALEKQFREYYAKFNKYYTKAKEENI